MLGKEKLEEFASAAFATMEDEAPPDAFIGAAMLIVEVRHRDEDGGATAFYAHCTDQRGWVQRALLEEARTAQVFAGQED